MRCLRDILFQCPGTYESNLICEGEFLWAQFKAVNEALRQFLVLTKYYAVVHVYQDDDI